MPTQATLTTILVTDIVSDGPTVLNGNFAELNLPGTELSAGNMQIALSGDAITGTDNQLAMTPLKSALLLVNTRTVMPNANNIYSLGTTSRRYTDLHLGGNVNFAGGDTLEVSGTDILVNGSIFSPAVISNAVELTGNQVVQGQKTWVNDALYTSTITLSAANGLFTFDELGTGDSGIRFQEAGVTIGSMLFDQTSQAVKARINDTFNYSWQFPSEVIFGEGTKTAPDFVSGVASNGITASKIKRYREHVNVTMTTVSGANVPVDWTAGGPYTVYLDEGESGNMIVCQNTTDVHLPPLTRDGGLTNIGGTLYTIVNMSNNNTVDVIADASIGDTIAGSANLANSTRFSTITLKGVYRPQFGTGSKEGHWVVVSREGTWV